MDAPSNYSLPCLPKDILVPRTLLIGDSARTWKHWLKTHLGGRDFICLDPADIVQSPPGRLTLHRGGKTVAWSFYGSLDPLRAPHVMLAGLQHLLERSGEDAVVMLPPFRNTPLFRQFAMLAAGAIRPSEAFVTGESARLEHLAPKTSAVELEEAFSEEVQQAQRKAHWIKMIEECVPHEVPFREVEIEGARLGAGIPIAKPLSGSLYAEACGATLLVISEGVLDDDAVAKSLDATHCSRAVAVRPDAYDGLLCAFSKQNGESFGIGLIQNVNFDRRIFRAMCTAIPPAPVRILRLGGLRLSLDGDERSEIRPWQV